MGKKPILYLIRKVYINYIKCRNSIRIYFKQIVRSLTRGQHLCCIRTQHFIIIIFLTFPELLYNTNIFFYHYPEIISFFKSVIQAIDPQNNPALSTTQHNQTGRGFLHFRKCAAIKQFGNHIICNQLLLRELFNNISKQIRNALCW